MNELLIFEDESYDRAFSAGELSEAGALTLVAEGGELTSVTLVRAAEGAVREYFRRFGGELLSDGAIAFLDKALAPLFEKCGYERDCDSPYTTLAFAADGGREYAIKPLPRGVSLVWCAEGEGERYDFSLIDGGGDDGECALALRGETVLCVAGINDLRRDGYSEIYVECAESARRAGLGSACVSLLSSHLLSAGQGVRYETTGDNAASIALARSLGMREIERMVSFLGIGRDE